MRPEEGNEPTGEGKQVFAPGALHAQRRLRAAHKTNNAPPAKPSGPHHPAIHSSSLEPVASSGLTFASSGGRTHVSNERIMYWSSPSRPDHSSALTPHQAVSSLTPVS